MTRLLYGSLTRISDLEREPHEVVPIDSVHWSTGDYVAGTVVGPVSDLYRIESPRGEMLPVQPGERVVGAFGERAATLEGVGSWRDIVDGHMHCLTGAGLIGAFTSLSSSMASPLQIDYLGHVVRNGHKLSMDDWALQPNGRDFDLPTVLLVGTSMSAGKTTTGRLVCKALSGRGRRVIGAKLTGAGRYRDILSFKTAGAAEIFDFVDVGLPSTVLPEADFRPKIRTLLRHIAARTPEILVAEAGASPLEPYNGAAAIGELGRSVRCTILCASDPYAVVGVMQAFGLAPDLVAGPAASTKAAIDLVETLTGIRAIDVLDPASEPVLAELLAARLDLPDG